MWLFKNICYINMTKSINFTDCRQTIKEQEMKVFLKMRNENNSSRAILLLFFWYPSVITLRSWFHGWYFLNVAVFSTHLYFFWSSASCRVRCSGFAFILLTRSILLVGERPRVLLNPILPWITVFPGYPFVCLWSVDSNEECTGDI